MTISSRATKTWEAAAHRTPAPTSATPRSVALPPPSYGIGLADQRTPADLPGSVDRGVLRRACACGGPPGSCACPDNKLLRRASDHGKTERAPSSVHDVLRSGGEPLPRHVRTFFEPRLGHDLAGVRVHTDGRAAESARAVSALAYTVGQHVVFAAGEYAPASSQGRRLLAHELAHTIQQRGGDAALQRATGLTVGSPDDQMERAADFAADRALEGAPPGDTLAPGGAAQVAGLHVARQHRPGGPRRPPQRQADDEPETTEPTAGALAALAAAQALAGQTDPAIWFDSWGNDLRDNDRNGAIDTGRERGLADGTHYRGTYRADVCAASALTVDQCPSFLVRTVDVTYKVCIDIPIEAYRAAGVPISTSRWIPSFFAALARMPGWRVWSHGRRPSRLLDGDIVAASNPQHQHAGIVSTGTVYDSVINLPGPTSARRYGLHRPGGLNDIVTVPRTLFESILGIDYFARRVR